MKEIYKLSLVLVIDVLVLIWLNSSLSISIYELNELKTKSLNGFYASFAKDIFGEYYMRFAYIFLHILSNILLYKISLKYLKKENYLINIIFNLTPGVLASALLINPAGLIIFISLLLIYLESFKQKYAFYIALVLSVFVDKAMLSFYVACMIYAYFKRFNLLFFLSFLLFLIGIAINGYDFSGRPRGYFLDSLAIMAAVFSPPLFLYFFYTIYYTAFKGKKDLLFFVSASAFIICLLLSFRQKPDIAEFLPFLVLSIPLIVSHFLNSFKVHLPQFRAKHKSILYFVMVSLIFSYLFVVFSPFLYHFISYDEHFAKNYHLSKEIAKALKDKGIERISRNTNDFRVLEFYGINPCYYDCKVLVPCDDGVIKFKFFMKEFQYCLR